MLIGAAKGIVRVWHRRKPLFVVSGVGPWRQPSTRRKGERGQQSYYQDGCRKNHGGSAFQWRCSCTLRFGKPIWDRQDAKKNTALARMESTRCTPNNSHIALVARPAALGVYVVPGFGDLRRYGDERPSIAGPGRSTRVICSRGRDSTPRYFAESVIESSPPNVTGVACRGRLDSDRGESILGAPRIVSIDLPYCVPVIGRTACRPV